jgi:hypothetical protein
MPNRYESFFIFSIATTFRRMVDALPDFASDSLINLDLKPFKAMCENK